MSDDGKLKAIKVIKFVKRYPPFLVGDVGGFTESLANEFIAKGYAEPVKK